MQYFAFDVCGLGGAAGAAAMTTKRSSATAEIARDADDVEFSVGDVHSALTLAFNSFNSIIIL